MHRAIVHAALLQIGRPSQQARHSLVQVRVSPPVATPAAAPLLGSCDACVCKRSSTQQLWVQKILNVRLISSLEQP